MFGSSSTGLRREPRPGGIATAHDYVVVPMLDGKLLLEEPNGSSRIAELRTHVPYERRAGVEHNVINANDYEFAFLEIEILR